MRVLEVEDILCGDNEGLVHCKIDRCRSTRLAPDETLEFCIDGSGLCLSSRKEELSYSRVTREAFLPCVGIARSKEVFLESGCTVPSFPHCVEGVSSKNTTIAFASGER